MPDIDGVIEDSDWEFIESEAVELKSQIIEFAESVRHVVTGMTVHLPTGCIGRSKEKWRPLMRVAMAAGGRWPAVADDLIARGLNEEADEREAGLKNLPPGMVVLTDLNAVWPEDDDFVPTGDLVSRLIAHNPEFWGVGSAFGKPLTEKRFGQLVAQASKVTSQRPGGRGRRGYSKSQLVPVWSRLGIGRPQMNPVHPAKAVHPVQITGCTGLTTCTGSKPNPPHRALNAVTASDSPANA